MRISTRGSVFASTFARSNGVNHSSVSHASTRAGARPSVTLSPSIQPSTPYSRVWNVSVRYEFDFVTSRAAWISSLSMSTVPKQNVCWDAATLIAL